MKYNNGESSDISFNFKNLDKFVSNKKITFTDVSDIPFYIPVTHYGGLPKRFYSADSQYKLIKNNTGESKDDTRTVAKNLVDNSSSDITFTNTSTSQWFNIEKESMYSGNGGAYSLRQVLHNYSYRVLRDFIQYNAQIDMSTNNLLCKRLKNNDSVNDYTYYSYFNRK